MPLGEPDVPVGARKNTKGKAVRRRDFPLRDDSIGGDLSDTVSVALGEPEIPIRTHGYGADFL